MSLAVNGEDALGYDTVGASLTEAQMTAIVSGTDEDPGSYVGDTITNNYDIPATAGSTAGDAKRVVDSGSGPCWEAFVNWTVDPVGYPWSETCFATGVDDEPVPEPSVDPGAATGVSGANAG